MARSHSQPLLEPVSWFCLWVCTGEKHSHVCFWRFLPSVTSFPALGRERLTLGSPSLPTAEFFWLGLAYWKEIMCLFAEPPRKLPFLLFISALIPRAEWRTPHKLGARAAFPASASVPPVPLHLPDSSFRSPWSCLCRALHLECLAALPPFLSPLPLPSCLPVSGSAPNLLASGSCPWHPSASSLLSSLVAFYFSYETHDFYLCLYFFMPIIICIHFSAEELHFMCLVLS